MTASVRARINTFRAKRTTDNYASYIQEITKRTVSNVHISPSSLADSGPAYQDTVNEATLLYFGKIDDLTKAIING